MNKYRDKSDFEINKAVFRAARIKHKWFKFLPHGVVTYNITGKWVTFDPCNNPADAMPIIIENNISLHAPIISEEWAAEHTSSDDDVNDGFQADYFDSHNQNPLRAAMEVFLMMKEAENEK